MATTDEKLEKVEYLNNINLNLVRRGFTGKRTIHWYKGEPKIEEENNKKDIILE